MGYTQGKWFFEKSKIPCGAKLAYDRYYIATDKKQESGRQIIAFLNNQKEHGRFVDETEANARLIAAAPELLQVLDKAWHVICENCFDTEKKTLELIATVIKKTKGE